MKMTTMHRNKEENLKMSKSKSQTKQKKATPRKKAKATWKKPKMKENRK
jgi:hypothetical protein